MFSRIKENILHKFVSIEHIGFVSDGVVDTTSEAVKQWAPSFENYTFSETNGGTELKIDLQVPPDYVKMFSDMWPAGLNALKDLCEK